MVLGIDASNIRAGGGLTHLKQILNEADPSIHGFEKVVIWSNQQTLDVLPKKEWLVPQTHPYLNRSFLWSFAFQMLLLSKSARVFNCSLLFAPGSTFVSSFRPFVTISQNMLPFEFHEAFRFNKWRVRLRFLVLYLTQSYTFRRAAGLIFLTNYAKEAISSKINLNNPNSVIIPHGINMDFSNMPKVQLPIDSFSTVKPFRLLYVSIITAYKHQWNVAAAVLQLKLQGFPVAVDFIGPDSGESFDKLRVYLDSADNNDGTLRYLGPVKYEELAGFYKNADAFVFASSCENLPIILLEAMSAGLPVACSDKGPMPEVLGDAGIYFDPENIQSIFDALKELLENAVLRDVISKKAYEKTINYTWKNCSGSTFEFLSAIAKKTHHEK